MVGKKAIFSRILYLCQIQLLLYFSVFELHWHDECMLDPQYHTFSNLNFFRKFCLFPAKFWKSVNFCQKMEFFWKKLKILFSNFFQKSSKFSKIVLLLSKFFWAIFRIKKTFLSWDLCEILIFLNLSHFFEKSYFFSIFSDFYLKLQFHIFMGNRQNEKQKLKNENFKQRR